MKNLIRLVILAAVAATFVLPALAQDTTGTATAAQDEEKAKVYNRWLENRKGSAEQQKTAYEAGKEFLQKYATADPSADDAYAKAVRKWVGNYEKATRDFEYSEALRTDKPDVAFRLGREIYAAEPARIEIPVTLAWMGYQAMSRPTGATDTYNGDAANYARQALQLIESGKAPASWSPFKDREEAIGALNFALGSFVIKQRRYEEAAAYFYKAAQQQNAFTAKEASTYANLGEAYARFADYTKLINDYSNLVKTDPNAAGSDEAKAILAKLDPMTDRIMDAYARAIALAGTNPRYTTQKADWTKRLTDFYKFRNPTVTEPATVSANVNQFIAGVLSTPLPSATETPAPAAATTAPTTSATPTQPATGTGNGSAAPPAATPTPATTRPASTTTTTPSTVKPAAPSSTTTSTAKPAPAKPTSSTGSSKPTATPTPRPKR